MFYNVQVSDNPRRESLRRGWELLAICLGFFPPSETFQPYLQGFIQKHNNPNMDFPEVGRWPLYVQVETSDIHEHVKLAITIIHFVRSSS